MCAQFTTDDAERFWKRVQVGVPDECWPWQGCVRSENRKGQDYGVARFRGRDRAAHQVALELATGEEKPEGKICCHTCDTPRCCNPAHLWWGTHKENTDDMQTKGRGYFCDRQNAAHLGSITRGETCNWSKLTEADVVWIREQFAAGILSKIELASLKGVSRDAIQVIVTGKNWKHVGGPITRVVFRQREHELQPEDRELILSTFEEGNIDRKTLALAWQISHSQMCRILKREAARKRLRG